MIGRLAVALVRLLAAAEQREPQCLGDLGADGFAA